MKFHVVYTHSGKWWMAEAPFLAGAYSQGRTRESARKNLLSAIRDLLRMYRDLGEEPPLSSVEIELDVADLGK